MSVNKYNKNADSNVAVGDGAGTVGIQEGMPRRDVNNAMRSICADIAKYADDNSYITTGGTASGFTVTTSSEYTAYAEKMAVWVKFHVAPDTDATVNFNNLGEKQILILSEGAHVNVAAGHISSGDVVKLIYDGTGFVAIGVGASVAIADRARDYGSRNAGNAAAIAGLPNGTIAKMEGLSYLVDSTATGSNSATNDLGQSGLVAIEPATPQHYGAYHSWQAAIASDASIAAKDTAAFLALAANHLSIKVPWRDDAYVVNEQINGLDDQIWEFFAHVTHTDETKKILSFSAKKGFRILGALILSGTLTTGATAAETGLSISGCAQYIVENVSCQKFKGAGYLIEGASALTSQYGDEGQFIGCSAYECTTGWQAVAGSGAEYAIVTNGNAAGCILGVDVGAGNLNWTGGNITGNGRGVVVRNGANHAHGCFTNVQINHNTVYNVEVIDVIYGHQFKACHLYGNGGTAGAIFLDQCKNVVFADCVIDCDIYSYHGEATSGLNHMKNCHFMGDYGQVTILNAASAFPENLIITGATGIGAYNAEFSISTPDICFALAERHGTTQAITASTSTTLQLTAGSLNDYSGAWSGSVFTVPSGRGRLYRVTLSLIFAGTSLDPDNSYVDLVYTGGTTVGQELILPTAFGTGLLKFNASVVLHLDEADTCYAQANIAGSGVTFGHGTYRSFISFEAMG